MNPARVAAVSWDELLGMRIGAVLRDSDYSGATQVRSIADLEVGTEVLVAQLAALAIPPRRTLTSLRRRHGPICVVVIIPHRDSTDVARFLTAGLEGTVDEADLEASLTPTIDAARCGQVVVHPARRPRGVLRDLPRRQAQVLNLLALGLTNAEIARRLSVSETPPRAISRRCSQGWGFAHGQRPSPRSTRRWHGIPPRDSEKAANSAVEDLLMNDAERSSGDE